MQFPKKAIVNLMKSFLTFTTQPASDMDKVVEEALKNGVCKEVVFYCLVGSLSGCLLLDVQPEKNKVLEVLRLVCDDPEKALNQTGIILDLIDDTRVAESSLTVKELIEASISK